MVPISPPRKHAKRAFGASYEPVVAPRYSTRVRIIREPRQRQQRPPLEFDVVHSRDYTPEDSALWNLCRLQLPPAYLPFLLKFITNDFVPMIECEELRDGTSDLKIWSFEDQDKENVGVRAIKKCRAIRGCGLALTSADNKLVQPSGGVNEKPTGSAFAMANQSALLSSSSSSSGNEFASANADKEVLMELD